MSLPASGSAWEELGREVVTCALCPRLEDYREGVAREKKREFRAFEYWGRPVPSFGDRSARLLVIGLAPAAHGGNRTGRVFTGDSSGTWLVRALHKAGFASQPNSVSRDDGLKLRDTYITAIVRCAPPKNKPLPSEVANCRRYLQAELDLLARTRVVVTLGRIAFAGYLAALRERGSRLSLPPFQHGREYQLGPDTPAVLASYHPSRQNTSTGRLTEPMLDGVFRRARELLEERS